MNPKAAGVCCTWIWPSRLASRSEGLFGAFGHDCKRTVVVVARTEGVGACRGLGAGLSLSHRLADSEVLSGLA